MGRYGLTDKEVLRIASGTWKRIKKTEHGWADFDAFLRWCTEEGWRPGAYIHRFDQTRPHGPENSYWESRNERVMQHPCPSCDREKKCTIICRRRLAYWDETMRRIRHEWGVGQNG